MEQVGKIKRKHSGHFGSFFFGFFIGLLLTLGAIVGVGVFAYYNISINWLNSTFNTNIEIGSEQLRDLTANKLLEKVMHVAGDFNNYTLNDLKADFGIDVSEIIGNDIMGIDISDLKDVPIVNIVDSLQNKFNNLTAEELNGIISLESLDNILNKTNTFYYNEADNKLYKTESFSELAEFDYEIVEEGEPIPVKKVKIKNFDLIDITQQESHQVANIQLRYLPLSTAFNSFSDVIGDLTLEEMETQFNITLPSLFDDYKQSKLSELNGIFDTMINDMTLAKMEEDFNITLPSIFNDYKETKLSELNTTFNEIIQNLTIEDLQTEFGVTLPTFLENYKTSNISQLGSIINNLQLSEILDYKYKNGSWYKGDQQITGILSALAGYTVNNIDSAIDNLTIKDVFPDRSGVLSLVAESTPIKDIPSAIMSSINTSTVSKLIKLELLPSSLSGKTIDDTPIDSMTFTEFTQKIAEVIDKYNQLIGTLG